MKCLVTPKCKGTAKLEVIVAHGMEKWDIGDRWLELINTCSNCGVSSLEVNKYLEGARDLLNKAIRK